jgi:hypothetical protein
MAFTSMDNAGLVWQKASKSRNNSACVEIASAPGMVAMRDSKNPDGPVLSFPAQQWAAFLERAKEGAYDL